jgi:hypothetical protein
MSILASAERQLSVAASRSRGRDRVPAVGRETTMGSRVIVTTGFATLYLVACLAALSLVVSVWSASL